LKSLIKLFVKILKSFRKEKSNEELSGLVLQEGWMANGASHFSASQADLGETLEL